jgi:hypothetical protein
LTAESWPAFVSEIKQGDPLLGSMLENATFLRGEKTLCLGVANKFYRTQLTSGSTHNRLLTLIQSKGHAKLEVKEVAGDVPTIASKRAEWREGEREQRREGIASHPVTQTIVEALGAEIVDIQPEDPIDE